MANQMSLDDLKKSLRSLLTSTPNALTMERLNIDYREFFGMNIPYQKFEYNSLEQFLKSNPDICVVNGTGRFATITPCISEKAAHINEMVMRQKKTAPKGRRTRGMQPRFQTRGFNQSFNQFNRPSERPPPLKRPQGYAMSSCTSSNSSMGSFNQQNYAPPTEAKSWTVQNPVGQTTFKSQDNNNSNQTDVSKSPTVITEKPSVPLTNNNNVTQPKTNEMKYILDTSGKDDGWNVIRSRVEVNNTEKATTGPSPAKTSALQATRNNTLSVRDQNRNVLISRKNQLEGLIQGQIRCGNVSRSPTSGRPESQLSSQPEIQVLQNILPDDRPVLEEEDKYMFTSKTLELFKPHLKQQDPEHRLLSFSSDSKANEPVIHKSEIVSNVPSAVQERLKNLISKYDDGVWCADLPDIYRKQFRRELRFDEYGYTSLIEMCISLKDIFHYVRPGKDDFKLYDCTKPLPENAAKNYTMASYDFGEQDDKEISMKDAVPKRLDIEDFEELPKDIFAEVGVEIERQFLPEGTKTDSILDVVVVEAYDPSKFWFYLGTSDKTSELDILMNDIQEFYKEPKNRTDYAVPPTLIRKDMYLLQIWYGEYHRAKVLERLDGDNNNMRVYFIDYGTVARTPVQGALFLHQKFAQLPAQAIRCSLSNVAPVERGFPWSTAVSEFFRDWVNGRDTKIKISFIDWEDEYVCGFLADVSDYKKVTYINEIMVKEGMAVWGVEGQKEHFVLPNYRAKVKNLHFFPTFFELECGMAPNAADMLHLESLKVPLNFCLPQYFDWVDDLESDEEIEVENHYNLFIETVKNNRKCLPWNLPIVKSDKTELDFSVFGEMVDELRAFAESRDQFDNQAYECYEQQYSVDETETELNEANPYSCEETKEMYAKYGDDIKSYSESILKELDNATDFDEDCKYMSPFDDHYRQSEIVESELAMLLEDKSDEFESIYGDDRNTVYEDNDINIFDNPELFEKDRENNYEEEEVTGKSFLRKLEKLAAPVSPISDSFVGSSQYLDRFLSKSSSDLSTRSKSRESSLKSFISKSITKDAGDGKKRVYDSDSSENYIESFLSYALKAKETAKLLASIKTSADGDCEDRKSRSWNSFLGHSEANQEIFPVLPDVEETRRKFDGLATSTNPFLSLEFENDVSVGSETKRFISCTPTSCTLDTTGFFSTIEEPHEETTTSVLNESQGEHDASEPKESPEPKPSEPTSSFVRFHEAEPFEFKVPYLPSKISKESSNAGLESPTSTTVSNINFPGMDGKQSSKASSVCSSRSSHSSTSGTPNALSTSSVPSLPSNFFEVAKLPTSPFPVGGPTPQLQGYGPPHNQGYGLPQNQGYGPPNPYLQWSDGGSFQPAGTGQWNAGNNQQANLKPPPGFAPKTNAPQFSPNPPQFNPNAPQFNPNAPQFNPNAPQFNPNAPQFNPNAPQFNPNAPQFNPNAPQFNPNASQFNPNAPQFNPNAPQFNPNAPSFISALSQQQPPNYNNPFMNYQNYQQQNYVNYVNQQRFMAMQIQQNAMYFQGHPVRMVPPPVRPPATAQAVDFYDAYNQKLLRGGNSGGVPSDSGKPS